MLEVIGSKQLYQWDTGRMAQVTVECDEVHFSNLKFGKAFVVDVVDGAVPIPDELLTVGENIYTWAYVGVAENGYTKQEQVLSVTKRAKPSDYVFTPTEQITLEKLLQKINEGVYDGATFVPSVSADGVISWTNDRDLPNPTPVNIKGDKGEAGKNGTNGKDGYTPVKSKDYFTDADKQEMVNSVISALPKYNGEVIEV